jgi:hypothetical protein
LAHDNRSARLLVVYVIRAKLHRDSGRERTKTTVDSQNSATDQGRKNSIDDAAPACQSSRPPSTQCLPLDAASAMYPARSQKDQGRASLRILLTATQPRPTLGTQGSRYELSCFLPCLGPWKSNRIARAASCLENRRGGAGRGVAGMILIRRRRPSKARLSLSPSIPRPRRDDTWATAAHSRLLTCPVGPCVVS